MDNEKVVLKLEGKIKVIFDKQTFDSGFEKREVVVTTAEEYPQDVKFELYKEKCDTLNDFKVGQDVTVLFNLRGNEYNGKYFVNLNAWKIESKSSDNVMEQPIPTVESADLPF